jgi:hypothetical protein
MNSYQDYAPYGADARGRSPDGRSMAGGEGKRARVVLGIVGVAFAVTLAVVIGQRLSDQAISILAGAVCGVAASIPTSLLIVWVTRRRQEPQPMRQPMPGMYPPVVVVQPPPQASHPALQQPGYAPPYSQPLPREFTVVGGEAQDAGGGYW